MKTVVFVTFLIEHERHSLVEHCVAMPWLEGYGLLVDLHGLGGLALHTVHGTHVSHHIGIARSQSQRTAVGVDSAVVIASVVADVAQMRPQSRIVGFLHSLRAKLGDMFSRTGGFGLMVFFRMLLRSGLRGGWNGNSSRGGGPAEIRHHIAAEEACAERRTAEDERGTHKQINANFACSQEEKRV